MEKDKFGFGVLFGNNPKMKQNLDNIDEMLKKLQGDK